MDKYQSERLVLCRGLSQRESLVQKERSPLAGSCMKRDPNCQLCPLHQTAEYVCLLGQGPEPCEAMLIGEAPGEREDDSGKPFVGKAGQLLDEMLENVGLSRKKLFITNAVSCRPPDNRTPKAREIDACRKWVKYQIAMVKPKYIALLGNVALQSVLGVKGIKKMRGRPIEADGIIYFPMYHPSYILRGDRKDQPLAEQDFKAFKEIIDFGGIPEERELNFTIVDTWEKVDQMIDALTGAVSADLETTCLYPWAPEAKVVMLGFGTASGEFDVPIYHKDSPWSDKDIEIIVQRATEKLESCFTIFHVGKFDALWMLVHYGVEWHNDFDTLLAHHAIDENSAHDLEYLAELYFGAPRWDIPLHEKQGNAPIPKIAKYHAHDLFNTRRLYYKLKKELEKEPDVYRVFRKITMPCANLYVKMENEGCYIDMKKMKEVEKYLLSEINKAEIKLKKWGDINWASPKQVGELLYGKLRIKCPLKTNKGANSTSESALKQIEHPCVVDLLKFRGHRQQHSFFIEGWKPYVINNRIHPSFKLHGTVTGRPSCEHPNFQQVPRDTLIRSLMIAPPGWTLVEADLSQIELRIVAELSRVPSMVSAFINEVDIHWQTAINELERYVGEKELVIKTAKIETGKTLRYSEAIDVLRKMGPGRAEEINPAWKETRKKAKAVNFGYVYGMWWKKFRMYARDKFDMHLTDEEAQDSRIAFFQLYPLENWHKKQSRFARENGYVETLTGRKRRLPHAQDKHDTYERAEAWRQAINAPVQGFAAEMLLMTLLELAASTSSKNVRPVITVHDSVLFYVKNGHVEEAVHLVEKIMKGPALFKAFDIKMEIPICGETKIGPWGSGISLNKWRQ